MNHRTIQDIIQNQTLVTTQPSTVVSEAIGRMNQAGVGAIVIVDDSDALIGIFTERDVLTRVLGQDLDPKTTPLAEVMSKRPIALDVSRPLMYAFVLMQENGFRHIPIVKGEKAIGIISLRDMMSVDLAELENILKRKDDLSEVISFGG